MTLSFRPRRTDIVAGRAEESRQQRSALRSAVIVAGDGDVPVVDARANLQTGYLGEMLMTALHAARRTLGEGGGSQTYGPGCEPPAYAAWIRAGQRLVPRLDGEAA